MFLPLYDFARAAAPDLSYPTGHKCARTSNMFFAFCCAAEETQGTVDLNVSEALPPKTSPEIKELEVKEVKKVKEEPAPEFGSFTITIPCKDFSFLGLQIDKTSSTMPMIKEVKSGAVQKFNELNPSRCLRLYDVLVALDETSGTDAIWKKMNEKPAENVTLRINRPRRMEISLVKTGGLGVKLDYKNISIGGVIDEVVESGLISKWNKEHPSDVVQKGDRIVGCNGKDCFGDELLDAIKKAENNMTLTVLKY